MEGEGRLSSAVAELQRLFEHALQDLHGLADVLDSRMVMKFQQLGDDEVNPRRTIHRLTVLKDRLENAQTRSAQLISTRQEVAKESVRLTHETAQIMSQLRRAVALPETTVLDFSHEIKQLGGSDAEDVKESQSPQNEQLQSTIELSSEIDSENTEPNRAPAQASKTGKRNLNSTSKASQARAKVFEPVTEEEFLSVSELVRGRSKLEDINKVYEVLYEHFNKQQKKQSRFQDTEPLSIKDMSAMGLKITGKTGEAKLAVLKTLKLINMSNKGVMMP
eukprot:m.41862 g.41862  ORF g.41862 m.41862 type:complete len:277 (+) comp11865_c0_seq2:126-956(+)